MAKSWALRFVALIFLVMLGGQTLAQTPLPSPLDEAQRLLDAGRPADAVRTINEHFAEADRDAAVWFVMAESYHVLLDEAGLLKKRGLAKKMKQCLMTALEIEPTHVDARRELADFYFYAPRIVGGSKDEAAKHLELLERVAPVDAHLSRGQHANNAREFEKARQHYRKALEFGPLKPQHLVTLAVIEQQLESYSDSIALLDEAIVQDPDFESAYFYRARASALTGLDIDRGLECAQYYLEHCTKCDNRIRGHAWWRRATLLKRKGETNAAVAAYREALRFNDELEGARKGLKELEQ